MHLHPHCIQPKHATVSIVSCRNMKYICSCKAVVDRGLVSPANQAIYPAVQVVCEASDLISGKISDFRLDIKSQWGVPFPSALECTRSRQIAQQTRKSVGLRAGRSQLLTNRVGRVSHSGTSVAAPVLLWPATYGLTSIRSN